MNRQNCAKQAFGKGFLGVHNGNQSKESANHVQGIVCL